MGITVCTYPNGKLGDGMQYESIVSSGFTSPVIAGCLLDRNVDGALDVAGHLRQRHDGRITIIIFILLFIIVIIISQSRVWS